MRPRATYRVQLSSAFTFDDAAALAGYLHDLGVSHLYCSPILQAAAGSAHGYDVVDPAHLSADLGGEPGFNRLVAAMHRHAIELIVDIVPNHIATAGRANPWWWNLLTDGPASPYAGYFDIDWEPASAQVKNKVLIGVLADRYGRELENRVLHLDRVGRTPIVRYRDQTFPLSPESLEGIDLDEAEKNPDILDALLQRQHYRLAYWRSAQEELNYRRFFTIDSLIGLRVERDDVFAASHGLVLDLVRSKKVEGLRVDHIDGLRDPAGYLARLRSEAPEAYIAVEKITALDEALPRDFLVQGTTGYDFIAATEGLFIDPHGEAALTALYHAFTGEPQPYPEVVRAAKLEIANGELAPDFERLAGLLAQISERSWRQRDRTRRELLDAVRELAVGLGVYRTYARAEATSENDRRRIDSALAEARRRRPDIDGELLDFVGGLLRLEARGGAEEEFVARFQQLTPAVMAKGVEDTAFYRYNMLVSLNEVGGDPGVVAQRVWRFHDWCTRIARDWPDTMLTLSTHDTKRSADVRARLDLLSEMAPDWEAAVRRWAEHNDRYRAQGFPDRNLEYAAYQTLVGAWPIDATRLAEFLVKAAREAKAHTSWTDPAPAYEDAVRQFVASITSDTEFTADLESFIGSHRLVALGRTTSLALTTLLLTCPGVPDIYQGSEVWAANLVDPDNRRPVDYGGRRRLLDELREAGPEDALARADEGAPKLWLITRLLRHRRPRAGYTPLEASGARAGHVVAFLRDDLLVVVPRLLVGLASDWRDTAVSLPPGEWTGVLTGDRRTGGRDVLVSALTARFPVAVLVRTTA